MNISAGKTDRIKHFNFVVQNATVVCFSKYLRQNKPISITLVHGILNKLKQMFLHLSAEPEKCHHTTVKCSSQFTYTHSFLGNLPVKDV